MSEFHKFSLFSATFERDGRHGHAADATNATQDRASIVRLHFGLATL